jgi:hypothetical protein
MDALLMYVLFLARMEVFASVETAVALPTLVELTAL